jgi:hypothetical protein
VGVAERGDGVDAEVSDVCGRLYRDCYGCGDLGFDCCGVAGWGVGVVCCDDGFVGGATFVAGGSRLIGCGDRGTARLIGFEVVAVSYDDGRGDE